MVKNEKIFDAIEFKNIKEIVYHSAETYKNKIAFVVKHKINKAVEYENVTFQRLLEDINKLGTALYNMKLKGKRIAIMGKNCYEWALSYLSNLLGNNISVPLDKDLQYEELENSLIRSKADCIIFDAKYTDKITKIKKQNHTNLTKYICMNEIEGYQSVKQLMEVGTKLLEKRTKRLLRRANRRKCNEHFAIYIWYYFKVKSCYVITKEYRIKHLCNAMCGRCKTNRHKYCIFTISSYIWLNRYASNGRLWSKNCFPRRTSLY